MKKEASPYKLSDLSAFIEHQINLDECLQELAIMAANILNTQNCSIMLLKDDIGSGNVILRVFAHSGYLPEAAHHAAVEIKEGISCFVVTSGEPLFVEDIDKSPFLSLKRGRYKSKGFIAAPIMIHDRVIGVIHANTPLSKSNVNKRDLELLVVIALLIGKSIQVIQLQNLLNSRYAQYALSRKEDAQGVNLSVSAHQSPDKIAKILAKTFYAEMSKAGFGPDHMLTTATEIVSLLSDKLKKHKERRDSEQVKDRLG